ncbi:hypothetical protein [Aliiruegeria haliotis]|uniref:hypothetical protein n=1 Tax=Aliiruegeria haliotis TaxID=1280846 RepID=UPI001304A7EA|nr:hypothetical protein [Aliiruegeria haliotis]
MEQIQLIFASEGAGLRGVDRQASQLRARALVKHARSARSLLAGLFGVRKGDETAA